MAARIELKDLPQFLNRLIDGRIKRAESVWKRETIPLAKQLIDDQIGKGISPVEKGGRNTGGKARYFQYSQSYKQAIKAGRYGSKRLRPVNLKLTGALRKSLKGRVTRQGFSLFYTDKKAKYHNRLGAGKSKIVRQMLPDKGQNLSRVITRRLAEYYVELFERIN